MAKLYNLARMSTATTGTGTITLGSAVSGFLSFASAGIVDGDTVTYAIQDGAASEIGRGVYTAAGTTLTRSVLKSTNAGSPISLSGTAQVFITPSAEDFLVATNAQTGTTYTVLANDLGKLVTFSNVSAIAVTLPQATGAFSTGWFATFSNIGTGGVTITPTTSTIGGRTSIVVARNQSVRVVSNGTNWLVDRGYGGDTTRLRDSNDTHDLSLAAGSDLTADRLLTLTTGDADRTLTFSGNATLGAGPTIQIFTASGTWTKPTGLVKVKVTVIGAGGGGGGAAASAQGGGGGAGGAAIEYIVSGSLGATETVTIGAAGTAGASTPSNGGLGGTSSFGAHCSAGGGTGGQSSGGGGGGGSGTGGDINLRGNAASQIGAVTTGGSGGGSLLGGGGLGGASSAGEAGLYGGGGGGASGNGAVARAGGAGGAGIVIVEEYYS